MAWLERRDFAAPAAPLPGFHWFHRRGGGASFLFSTMGRMPRKLIGQKVFQSNFVPPLTPPISISEAHGVEPRLKGKMDLYRSECITTHAWDFGLERGLFSASREDLYPKLGFTATSQLPLLARRSPARGSPCPTSWAVRFFILFIGRLLCVKH